MTNAYTLLTGATGLLGRYLLRDLLRADWPVVAVVRGRREQSAADRIETVLAQWEREDGRTLPRPIVFQGSFDKPRLGLAAEATAWLRRHCGRVVHAAASLKFAVDPKDHEPFRTNVDGTRHLLDLCRELGLPELHHVSTAYVAGLREGVVREDELDVGQKWANAYEESKVAAERLVQGSRFLSSLTVYRPSIIVGDATTGYTTTFHGFYTPLRVAYALVPKLPVNGDEPLDLLPLFNLSGIEQKNLVPVDWVSQAIVRILRQPQRHGRTYHLTSARPVTVRQMHNAFAEVLRPWIGRDSAAGGAESLAGLGEAFTEPMRVYQSYWRNDPTFARTQLDAALPDLPCPALDHARLVALAQYAVDHKFGQAHIPFVRAEPAAKWLGPEERPVAGWENQRLSVGLRVTGRGGGDGQFELAANRLSGGRPGLTREPSVTYYLSAETLDQLRSGRLCCPAALEQGRVVVFGQIALETRPLAQLLAALIARPG